MSYILDTFPTISMPVKANNTVINELLSNYTYGQEWNVKFELKDNCITIGDYIKAELNDSECVLNVTDGGVFIKGINYSAMMHGFITFLENIKYCPENDKFYVENCCITEKPLLSFRGVHLCIFPETKLDFLKKCVRSCTIAKYSHIILEFWGMLKLDCMKELSWPFAYTKDEIKKIVAEANALGVEIIPMFNHLGHASLCRSVNGKHVVLDQNPRYEYMFDSYGWVWNLNRNDVCVLLGKIRDELIEVCGEGNYFHLGLDEAYILGDDENKAFEVADYLNKVSKELNEKGRRGIIWHDMLISKSDFENYEANSEKNVSDILIKNLDKNLVIADWQYSCHDENWKTSIFFKENQFDVLCCPWFGTKNVDEAVKTASANSLHGIIDTTWHTLYKGFGYMIYAGVTSYGVDTKKVSTSSWSYYASVARKALPAYGEYEKCGWTEKMVGPGL